MVALWAVGRVGIDEPDIGVPLQFVCVFRIGPPEIGVAHEQHGPTGRPPRNAGNHLVDLSAARRIVFGAAASLVVSVVEVELVFTDLDAKDLKALAGEAIGRSITPRGMRCSARSSRRRRGRETALTSPSQGTACPVVEGIEPLTVSWVVSVTMT